MRQSLHLRNCTKKSHLKRARSRWMLFMRGTWWASLIYFWCRRHLGSFDKEKKRDIKAPTHSDQVVIPVFVHLNKPGAKKNSKVLLAGISFNENVNSFNENVSATTSGCVGVATLSCEGEHSLVISCRPAWGHQEPSINFMSPSEKIEKEESVSRVNSRTVPVCCTILTYVHNNSLWTIYYLV